MWRFARVDLLSATAGVFSLPALAADLPARLSCGRRLCAGVFVGGFFLGGAPGWLGTNAEYTAERRGGSAFRSHFRIGKDGLSYGVLGGCNYQVGQLVRASGATSEARRLARCAHRNHWRSPHGAQQMGRLDPRAARLRCRPRSDLFTGGAALSPMRPDSHHRHLDRRRRHAPGMDGRSRHRLRLRDNRFRVSNTATRSTRRGPLRIPSPSVARLPRVQHELSTNQ